MSGSEDHFMPPEAPDAAPPDVGAPPPSLKKRVIKGSAISLIGQAVKQVLRLGGNLIVTRLLFPEAFGLMGIINALIMGLFMVSDLGVHANVIQSPRGEDQRFLDTCFTVQVIRGVVLWTIGILIAWPLSVFYGEPQLLWLVPAATFSAMLSGLESTKLPGLQRRIALDKLVPLEIFAQFSGILVMVVAAWYTRSVWALVIGSVLQPGVLTLLSHLAIKGPMNRFAWDRESAREVVGFGAWIFVSTLITFLALKADVLLLGKLIPMAMLGVYNIGGMLSTLPTILGGPVIGAVLLPALAESARADHETLKRNFATARRVILSLGVFVVLGPALLGPAFFVYLYDDRYVEAGWIVQLSMINVWFLYLQDAWSRALLAVGDSRALALNNAVRLVATIGGALLGFQLGQLPGFILGIAFGAFAGHVTVAWSLARHDLNVVALDLRYTVIGLAIGGFGVWIPGPVAEAIGHPEWQVHVSVATSVLILVPMGLWAGLGVLKRIKKK